ncbi:unnamed protein product [Brassica rapa subsp. narinosa]
MILKAPFQNSPLETYLSRALMTIRICVVSRWIPAKTLSITWPL